MVLIGVITGAHGIKGEVKLKSFAAEPPAIAGYGPLVTSDGRMDFGGFEWRSRTGIRLSPILANGVSKTLAECKEQARLHGKRWDETQQSKLD